MPSEISAIRRVTDKFVPLEANQSVVIHAGKVLTGKLSGDRVLNDQAVVIENGRIADVTAWAGYQVPAGAEVIDASDKTVMPGLIESHVHLTGEWPHDPHGTHLEPFPEARAYRAMLDAWAVFTTGFTTMFSMGHGQPSVVGAMKTMINNEGFPGPRVYHCHWALSQSGGHGHVRDWKYGLVQELKPRSAFVDGPYAIRRLVRENIGQGADFIKFYSGEGGFTASDFINRRLDFTDEEVQAITDESHRLGFQVAAHCVGLAHSEHAARNGVDRIEHGPVTYDPEFIPMLEETGASWCPTISQLYWGLQEREERGLSPEMAARIEQGIGDRCQMIQEALDKGVTVGFGTDNRMRPKAGANAIELKIMADNGIATLDVISIATQLAARLVRLEEHLGVVEAGKLADLLVVDGDPEADMSVLSDGTHVETIIKSHINVNPTAVSA